MAVRRETSCEKIGKNILKGRRERERGIKIDRERTSEMKEAEKVRRMYVERGDENILLSTEHRGLT